MIKLLLVATAFVLGGIAQAQTPEPAPELVKVGSELEKIAPYSGWKNHTGKVEDCLAIFTIETSEEAPIVYVTGVAIRCDGFLLAPVSVYDALNQPKTRVRVILSGAENEKLSDSLKIDGKSDHRSKRSETNVVKVSNHHMKAARLLDSVNLKPGTPVKVLTAVPLREGVGKVVHEAILGPQGDKDTWGLTFPEGKAPAVLEAGSVIVDIESDAVVGTISKASSAPYSFNSLAYFTDNCGEVGLCPDRDAVKFKAKPNSGMIRVAGGPVLVTDNDYKARYRTEVACTADFYCDRDLVSVQKYQEWMDAKKRVPWPNSWNQRQSPLRPQDVPGWPVTGVRTDEIRWMASDEGKRMLTWVEFERAAYTTDLKWLETQHAPAEIMQAINNVDRAFGAGVQQRVNASNVNRALAQQVLQSSGAGSKASGTSRGFSFASAVAGASSTDISDLTLKWAVDLDQIMRTLFPDRVPEGAVAKFRGPGWPHNVGSEAHDRSVWGVMDMISNVPEMVMGRGSSFLVMDKIAGARIDPFLSTVQWSAMATLGGGTFSPEPISGTSRGQVGFTHIANAPITDPLFWRAVFEARDGKPQQLVVPNIQTLDRDKAASSANIIGAYSRAYVIKPGVLPGFRLAR